MAAVKVDPLAAVAGAMITTLTWEASGPLDCGITPQVGSTYPDAITEDAELDGDCDGGAAGRSAERQPASPTSTTTAHPNPPHLLSTYLRCTKQYAGSSQAEEPPMAASI